MFSKKMKVLIACEFSGIVRDAFSAQGHDSVSCDLLPAERPGKHYQGDVRDILNGEWDIMIAFPPCTYLSCVANRHMKNPNRTKLRDEAMEFFMLLWNASIHYICIENPVGFPNTAFRKPDQIIHPYYFGDPLTKRTCLWLKNLPKLDYDDTIIPKPDPLYICNGSKCKGRKIYFIEGIKGIPVKDRWKHRSRTFPGVARAMAEQWVGD